MIGVTHMDVLTRVSACVPSGSFRMLLCTRCIPVGDNFREKNNEGGGSVLIKQRGAPEAWVSLCSLSI